MKSDARQTLADFFSRELTRAKEADPKASERSWAKVHGFRADDVRRARSGSVGITIDKLSEFAKGLGVEPWQMLFPGFERGAPQFPTMSVESLDVARQLEKIGDEAQRRRAYAAISHLLGMVTGAPSARVEPVGPPVPSRRPTRGQTRDS